MKVGGNYNWKHSPERLVYLGKNWSGNGYWHQFAKVEEPGVVWCEVLDSYLSTIEETLNPQRVCYSELNDGLEALRKMAIRSHRYCEDRWYSCPKSEDGCDCDAAGDECDCDAAGDECDCGADEHNTKVDRVFAATMESAKALGTNLNMID